MDHWRFVKVHKKYNKKQRYNLKIPKLVFTNTGYSGNINLLQNYYRMINNLYWRSYEAVDSI